MKSSCCTREIMSRVDLSLKMIAGGMDSTPGVSCRVAFLSTGELVCRKLKEISLSGQTASTLMDWVTGPCTHTRIVLLSAICLDLKTGSSCVEGPVLGLRCLDYLLTRHISKMSEPRRLDPLLNDIWSVVTTCPRSIAASAPTRAKCSPEKGSNEEVGGA